MRHHIEVRCLRATEDEEGCYDCRVARCAPANDAPTADSADRFPTSSCLSQRLLLASTSCCCSPPAAG